jgi:hypothetical protein
MLFDAFRQKFTAVGRKIPASKFRTKFLRNADNFGQATGILLTSLMTNRPTNLRPRTSDIVLHTVRQVLKIYVTREPVVSAMCAATPQDLVHTSLQYWVYVCVCTYIYIYIYITCKQTTSVPELHG